MSKRFNPADPERPTFAVEAAEVLAESRNATREVEYFDEEYMENQMYNLEFPVGHVITVPRLRALEPAGEEQIREIVPGLLLSAPGMSSEDCSVCQFERERRDRLYVEAGLGLEMLAHDS